MIGHDYTQDEIRQRVKRFWSLDKGFPIPHSRIACPVCKSKETIIKSNVFFMRNGPSPNHYRCDVAFKCTNCSMQWVHGIPIPYELFVRRVEGSKNKNKKVYSWRAIKCLLEKQQS